MYAISPRIIARSSLSGYEQAALGSWFSKNIKSIAPLLKVAGPIVGSIVPGVGTAIGAVAGNIVGSLAAGTRNTGQAYQTAPAPIQLNPQSQQYAAAPAPTNYMPLYIAGGAVIALFAMVLLLKK